MGRPVGRASAGERRSPSFDQRRRVFDRCFLVAPAVRRARFLEVGGFDEDVGESGSGLGLLDPAPHPPEARAGLVDEPLYRLSSRDRGSLTDDRAVARCGQRVGPAREETLSDRALRADDPLPAVSCVLSRTIGGRALLAEAEAALRLWLKRFETATVSRGCARLRIRTPNAYRRLSFAALAPRAAEPAGSPAMGSSDGVVPPPARHVHVLSSREQSRRRSFGPRGGDDDGSVGVARSSAWNLAARVLPQVYLVAVSIAAARFLDCGRLGRQASSPS